MTTLHQDNLSRRGFCLCCMAATTFAATGGWLSPSQAYAEARNIVDLIRDDAAKAPIKVHRLRGDVSILGALAAISLSLPVPMARCSSMPESPRPARES